MKKTLFLLAALSLATAGSSFAQTAPVKTTGSEANQTARHYSKGPRGPKDPAKMADHRAGKMAKDLGLNADQEAKAEQLMLTRQQEVAALKTKYGSDRKAGRADMKAAHDRYEAQLKVILTPEQYAKYQLKKDEHHGKKKEAGKMKMKTKA